MGKEMEKLSFDCTLVEYIIELNPEWYYWSTWEEYDYEIIGGTNQ